MRGCRCKREEAGGRSLRAASLCLRCSPDSCRALSLRWRLVEVARWNGATASALPTRAAFPEGTFIHLLCGARSPTEREATVPDCRLPTKEDRVLVQMLFPKRPRCHVGDAGSVLSPVFILKHIDVIDDCGEDVQNNECECPGLLCARRQVVIESLARKPLGFSQGLNGRVLSCLTTPCGGWLVVLQSQRTATPPVARRGKVPLDKGSGRYFPQRGTGGDPVGLFRPPGSRATG